MSGKYFSFVIVVLMASNQALAEGNPEAGKAASAVCAGCHGGKGISATGAFPNLAGQKADYLAAQLKAFRDKTRPSQIMAPMAASLKDDDIANLAAYFSSLKACE
ncbi:cytochrome subunit of sulfide dehydrogenase [Methylococcales bacterium]|nr:cytochrome subunit of sulfide dehydrogenase [Methylococcales bacterium]